MKISEVGLREPQKLDSVFRIYSLKNLSIGVSITEVSKEILLSDPNYTFCLHEKCVLFTQKWDLKYQKCDIIII